MFKQSKRRRFCLVTYQLAVMMLTVAAVLDVVQIVARLLAQQAELLGAGDVKLLLTSGFVALHARTGRRPRPFPQLLAYVAGCGKEKQTHMV